VLTFNGPKDLRRIVVLNPKGGSGKTTLAFNLAGYLASTGRQVALVDMDRQGSSTRWLSNRPADMPRILGISGVYGGPGDSGSREIVIPDHIEFAVVDAPAGLAGGELIDYTCGAHAILVPVLPSDLDIHAAARLISDLLLVAQVSRRNGRVGVVANRVKERTVAYNRLQRFLERLSIAVVGILRDSQSYTWAAAQGLCIHDMPKSRVGKDLEQWNAVADWLQRRLEQPLNARDLLRPTAPAQPARRSKTGTWLVAASVATLAVAAWWGSRTPGNEVVSAPESFPASSTPVSVSEALLIEPQPEPPAVPVGDKVRAKWQLSGIAKIGKSSVVILRDRGDNSTRQVIAGDNVDGWTISEAGTDYAVLTRDGEQVRLELVAQDPP